MGLSVYISVVCVPDDIKNESDPDSTYEALVYPLCEQ